MKIAIITITYILLTVNSLFAQYARYITSGSIEYEKSVNMLAIMKKLVGPNMQGFDQQGIYRNLKGPQQFKVLKSTLIFNADKTLFTPIPDEGTVAGLFSELPFAEQKNTVYTDLATNMSTNQKIFFEKTFLIKDSIRAINWKITDEIREIAGYTCRRANAIILDSVYVVAFYTNEIHVSGGPESFTGLPGMIMEVALPHYNVIWRATKVIDITIPFTAIVPARKGNPINKRQFMTVYDSMIKNMGTGQSLGLFKLDYLL